MGYSQPDCAYSRYGEKEFLFYAPDQTPKLHPKESSPNQSPSNIFEPDLGRYPASADAELITLTPAGVAFDLYLQVVGRGLRARRPPGSKAT